jgi:hypothetical protein
MMEIAPPLPVAGAHIVSSFLSISFYLNAANLVN